MLAMSVSVKKLADVPAGHIVQVPLRSRAAVALVVDGPSADGGREQRLLVLTPFEGIIGPALFAPPASEVHCVLDYGADFKFDLRNRDNVRFPTTGHHEGPGTLLLTRNGLLMEARILDAAPLWGHSPGYIDIASGTVSRVPDRETFVTFADWELRIPSLEAPTDKCVLARRQSESLEIWTKLAS
jgi:hypothetical protein